MLTKRTASRLLWIDMERKMGSILSAPKTGRSLPNVGFWGLIEDRLAQAIPNLWDDILASPQPDLEALYDKHISPLTNRLNIILSQA